MASRAVALDSTRGGRFTPARPRGTTQAARTPEPSKVKKPESASTQPGPASSDQTSPEQRDEQRDEVRSAAGRVTAPFAPVVDSGSGFVLGLLVWGWIVLPFLTGGATNVKNVLRAKFFNKAPDGSWLP